MVKKRLEVRLEVEFDDMLNILAFEQGMTRSDLIRCMIYDKHQELYNRLGVLGMKELYNMKNGCVKND